MSEQHLSNDCDLQKHLYDSDLVGYIQSIVVSSKSYISFLQSMRSDQGVHLCYLYIIQLLYSEFDLRFTCANVAYEHEGVVIFDLLHRTFRRQWVTDHRELIHPSHLRGRLTWVQTRSCQLQCLWTSEVHRCTYFCVLCFLFSFEHVLLGFLCRVCAPC